MITLRRFDPHQASVGDADFIVIIGKRQSGKTVLTKDLLHHLLHHLRKCPNLTLVYSPCLFYHRSYQRERYEYKDFFIPEHRIAPDYTEKFVDDFVARREQGCIVFENCLLCDEWTKHPSMHTLLTNGRCLGAKVVFVHQYPLDIPPVLRPNIDFVFIAGRTTHPENRKRMYDMYGGMFPTFELFCQTLDEVGKIPFACLVINNTVRSNKLEDIVMFYVASEDPDWRVMVEKKKESLDVFREELMRRTWHPRRVRQCLDIDEVREIFVE